MKQKIGILSLGCSRNLVDSEAISARLFRKGYSIVDIDKADVALVNTCAFIKEAKQESIDVILDLIDLKKRGKLKKIIVYGCLSQRYRAVLGRELPQIDAFVGKVSLDESAERFAITPRHYAYLKICEGCVNSCSFCVIPKIKGKFVSLSAASVLDKVDHFNRERISELNIIGQDITGYGSDFGEDAGLEKLLDKIIKRAGNIGWIRLLYLNPLRVSEGLLKAMRSHAKVCKYIDLPIQHINSRILKEMGRKIIRDEVERVIERVRKLNPAAAIRTSVIVGFPGETEREFKELLNFIKEAKFERLGAFKYSREEGTRAYHFKGQVPQAVKDERFNRVMSLQQEVSAEVNSGLLGRRLKVLVDEAENSNYTGRSEFDAPEVDGEVFIKSKKSLKSGDFVEVKITDTLEYDLVGEVL